MRRTSLWKDRSGITALEYGIIASALAFTLMAAFSAIGTPISSIFAKVGSSL